MSAEDLSLDPCTHRTLAEARVLLDRAELPTQDIHSLSIDLTVAQRKGEVLGVIGLEQTGALGLLRSLVVREDARKFGIGKALVEHTLARAQARDLSALYLLTTNAAAYFARYGFSALDRTRAPAPIRRTAQLASQCPSAAQLMVKLLSPSLDPAAAIQNAFATPGLEPPYYAVVFASVRTPGDHGYGEKAARMVELARQTPGCLGMESVRNAQGEGITVAYFRDLAAIALWRAHPEHQAAQGLGREAWYSRYAVRIARVEHAYAYPRPPEDAA